MNRMQVEGGYCLYHMGGGTTFILGGLSISIANFDHTHQTYSSTMDQRYWGGGKGLQPQSPMGSAAYVSTSKPKGIVGSIESICI